MYLQLGFSIRGQLVGGDVGCIEHMKQSNADAALVLAAFGVKCCTDVTGFGLLGHLKEVCQASQVTHSTE